MKKPIDIIATVPVSARADLYDALYDAGCEPVVTERTAYLSRSVGGRICVLPDVPGSQVDFLICDEPAWFDADRGDQWCVEAGRKAGKYDGRERWRLTVRPLQRRDVARIAGLPVWPETAPTPADVGAVSDFGSLTITVGAWSQAFQRLRCTVDQDRLDRIVRWHASRYFRHLDDDTVSSVGGLFAAEIGAALSPVGLAEANRLAERLLYRASRDAGWRKLTLRERHALGLVGGHWWREERIAMAREMHASGCGEATLAAASGDVCGTNRTWCGASAVHVARRPQEQA